MRFIVSALFLMGIYTHANAQCETWNNKPNMDDLIQDHVVYKGFLKDEKFDDAFIYWEKVFKEAPYADGRRIDHFYDGQQFYIRKYEAATRESEKDSLRKLALAIFDQEALCTGNPGPAMGRKGYYMFYKLGSPYPDTYKVLKKALDLGGDSTEYTVLVPMAYVLVDQFNNSRISIEEAQSVFTSIVRTADYQIEASGPYAAQYQQAKDAMMPTLEQIEGKLFDCEWFKAKLEPEYRANMSDGEKIKTIYLKLANQNCSESDPLLLEIKAKYEEYAEEVNSKLLAEYHQKNPGAHAAALYEAGKYSEALGRYRDALEIETDNDKKAEYYQSIASIEFRQLERYASARENAKRALKLRPNWGLPLLLIGDMYARSYRACGNSDFEQRCVILAAIEKYQEAKALDPSVASQANERISRYLAARPSYEDAHMLGKSEGEAYTIGCWIGETVTLRFNK